MLYALFGRELRELAAVLLCVCLALGDVLVKLHHLRHLNLKRFHLEQVFLLLELTLLQERPNSVVLRVVLIGLPLQLNDRLFRRVVGLEESSAQLLNRQDRVDVVGRCLLEALENHLVGLEHEVK